MYPKIPTYLIYIDRRLNEVRAVLGDLSKYVSQLLLLLGVGRYRGR